MSNVLTKTRSVFEVLHSKKYSIDYYQREYKWGKEQIIELLTDLEKKFLEKHTPNNDRSEVQNYPSYFLRSYWFC